MKIKKLSQVGEIKGKTVLLRVDFNVPTDENGEIKDCTRIVEAIPTIKLLQEKGAKIAIITHFGRPDGKVVEKLRVKKIAEKLSELIGDKVEYVNETIGEKAKEEILKIKNGKILVLENVRFYSGEELCDEEFTKSLADLGEVFVNDAFGAAHRRHSSTAGLAKYLPAYAGLLMEKEIENLSEVMGDKVKRPLTMIFGGAKIDTKIGIIENFFDKADNILIGGAIANTFLKAMGFEIGKSLYEEEKLEVAKQIMTRAEKEGKSIVLPVDVAVANEPNSLDAEIIEVKNLNSSDFNKDKKIFDIGTKTISNFIETLNASETVIWNGPLGFYEAPSFRKGSEAIAGALSKMKDKKTIIGGGDTADLIKDLKIDPKDFSHVSTGGGACIEFLSGESLPGIEVLAE